MIENIQIVNKNGDGMFVEGISYIEVSSLGKKYLFYTLNEKVDNNLTKIYIAETTTNPGEAQPIQQEEWDALRKLMVKISHKEPLEDVKFLNMNNVIFNVGDAKKLAVTSVAKQSFKDVQVTNTLPSNSANEAVVTGTTEFFKKDVEPVDNTSVDNTQNIFDNPIQPTAQPVQIVEESAMPNIQASPVIEESVMPTSVAQPVIEEPAIAAATSNDTTIQQQVIVDNIPKNENGEVIISDEEALKAIDIIQEYINQES